MTDHPAQPLADVATSAEGLPAQSPLVDQVADLRVQIDQQNRHIRALHQVVDQLIDELNRQTGTAWRPDLTRDAREGAPDMHVAVDHSRLGRRAEAKFGAEQP